MICVLMIFPSDMRKYTILELVCVGSKRHAILFFSTTNEEFIFDEV